MPLAYMLEVLRDETAETSRRDEMAKAAAPYCHPKLTNIDLRAYAELNARVEHRQVIDVGNMDPGARRQLKALLALALEQASEEPEEIEGEFSVSGED